MLNIKQIVAAIVCATVANACSGHAFKKSIPSPKAKAKPTSQFQEPAGHILWNVQNNIKASPTQSVQTPVDEITLSSSPGLTLLQSKSFSELSDISRNAWEKFKGRRLMNPRINTHSTASSPGRSDKGRKLPHYKDYSSNIHDIKDAAASNVNNEQHTMPASNPEFKLEGVLIGDHNANTIKASPTQAFKRPLEIVASGPADNLDTQVAAFLPWHREYISSERTKINMDGIMKTKHDTAKANAIQHRASSDGLLNDLEPEAPEGRRLSKSPRDRWQDRWQDSRHPGLSRTKHDTRSPTRTALPTASPTQHRASSDGLLNDVEPDAAATQPMPKAKNMYYMAGGGGAFLASFCALSVFVGRRRRGKQRLPVRNPTKQMNVAGVICDDTRRNAAEVSANIADESASIAVVVV